MPNDPVLKKKLDMNCQMEYLKRLCVQVVIIPEEVVDTSCDLVPSVDFLASVRQTQLSVNKSFRLELHRLKKSWSLFNNSKQQEGG